MSWSQPPGRIIPEVAITTDVMTGFPGETDDEFEETLDFIREMDFAGGHVFTYSARPGTPAARMRNQVPHDIRKNRNHILRDVFSELAISYRNKFIGRHFACPVGIRYTSFRFWLAA